MDPSVAIVENGVLIAFSEEERHIRIKHAQNHYPENALKYCLKALNSDLSEISAIAINWNLTSYNDGTIKSFHEGVRREFQVDGATTAWQDRYLRKLSWSEYRGLYERGLHRIFCRVDISPIADFPQHYTHDFQAHMHSSYLHYTRDFNYVMARTTNDVLKPLIQAKIREWKRKFGLQVSADGG